MTSVRTRFAPSPTGFVHVGNIRTGLFAYLVAKHAGGSFILRIEDTDKNREVAGSADHIKQSLQTLGITWDEGVDVGGNYGPYIQSERLDHYKKWAQKLIDAGRAYADPYTPQEVQAFREQAIAQKRAFRYRDHRPENPPLWDGTQPLRFKSEPKSYTYHDKVMGDITTSPEVIDDIILIKSDGYPTYNFAHIIDDAEMEITHIIRGQEFIGSMPNYLALYEALDITPPIFAHMPHIMNEQGNKKLGKRDGAKDILDYIREGYLPEALTSFIASLGWNDGTEKEVFSKAELIETFSLDRVQRSGARFDERRLLWMNGYFIRQLTPEALAQHAATFWPEEAADASDEQKQRILALVQERLKYFAELPELTRFFFTDLPVDANLISGHKQLSKLSTDDLRQLLVTVRDSTAKSDFSSEDLQERLNHVLETSQQKPVVLFSLVRIATTQAPASPGLAETMAVLGRDTCMRRIEAQLAAFNI